MTVQQAEYILLEIGIKIALQHRFAGDRGTILRLENCAMINIFDDGRYYVQGQNVEAVAPAFAQVEPPWDPDSWQAEPSEKVLPWFPPKIPKSRLEN